MLFRGRLKYYAAGLAYFLAQNTKTGKNIPNDDKIYQIPLKYFQ
jgi:hypothetical protein